MGAQRDQTFGNTENTTAFIILKIERLPLVQIFA
jgi:hypothetical protein